MGPIRCNFVQHSVTVNFGRLGAAIGRHPTPYIIIPILLSCFLGLGMLHFEMVDDFEYLFSPIDGRGQHEQAIVHSHFPMNWSNAFDPRRVAKYGPYGSAIVTAKDGGSVLRDELFKEIVKFDQRIFNLSIDVEGGRYSYKDLCAKARSSVSMTGNEKCYDNYVLHLAGKMKDIESDAFKVRYPLSLDQRTLRFYFYGGILGGVEIDSHGFIKSAKALRLMYYLDPNYVGASNRWEETFLEEIERLKTNQITISMLVSRTMGEEMDKNARSIFPKFVPTITMMLLFSVATSLMRDWVKGKPWLGVISCFSATLAAGAGFGLCHALGVEFTSTTLGVPFLMIGIAVDDSFVLLSSWRLTDETLSVEERMKRSYSHAGVSVTVTSLTNLLSFIVCTMTPIRALNNFSTYAAVSIIFAFIYQLCLFGGFMSLFGHLEFKNRHSLSCLKTVPLSLAHNKSAAYKLFCTGGKNPKDPHNPLDNREHGCMVFFRDYLGTFLTYIPVKIFILVVFFIYISVAIWGAIHLSEGLETDELFRFDSYAHNYSRVSEKYFDNYTLSIQVLITTPLDYSNETVQRQVLDLVNTFKKNPYISEYSDFWLTNYLHFTKTMGILLWKYDLNSRTDFIKCLRNVFFGMLQGRDYKNDVVFDDNNTAINTSRFFLQTMKLYDSEAIKSMLLSLRDIADGSNLSVTVFNPMFISYDQLIVIRSCTIQSVMISAIVMMFVTFFFFPNLKCGFLVAFSMASIEVGVIGFMVIWGVKLNTASMIGLIMCVGLAVDNTAHMTHAYMSSKFKDDPDERIKDALYFVGVPIVQASVSTFLGNIAMCMAPSQLYITLFKTVSLVLTFSCLNSIFILPVLLSLFDQCVKTTKKDPAAQKALAPEEKEDAKPIEIKYYLTSL